MASREGLSVYVSGAVAWAVQRAAEQRVRVFVSR
jgi:hypothetical protein